MAGLLARAGRTSEARCRRGAGAAGWHPPESCGCGLLPLLHHGARHYPGEIDSTTADKGRGRTKCRNATLATLSPDLAAAGAIQKAYDDLERLQLSRRHQLNALLGLEPGAKLALVAPANVPHIDPAAIRRQLATLADRRPRPYRIAIWVPLREVVCPTSSRVKEARTIAEKTETAFKQGTFDERSYVDIEVAWLARELEKVGLRQALLERQTIFPALLVSLALTPASGAEEDSVLVTTMARELAGEPRNLDINVGALVERALLERRLGLLRNCTRLLQPRLQTGELTRQEGLLRKQGANLAGRARNPRVELPVELLTGCLLDRDAARSTVSCGPKERVLPVAPMPVLLTPTDRFGNCDSVIAYGTAGYSSSSSRHISNRPAAAACIYGKRQQQLLLPSSEPSSAHPSAPSGHRWQSPASSTWRQSSG
jgi:hypothetical protein